MNTLLTIFIALCAVIGFLIVGALGSFYAMQFALKMKLRREADVKWDAFMQSLLSAPPGAVVQSPGPLRSSPQAIKVLEIGHYMRDCSCEDCKYCAQHDGIPLDAFFADEPWQDTGKGMTADGDAVIALTTPIATCTCAWCRQARKDGKPEMGPAEARAKFDAWNKSRGYYVDG